MPATIESGASVRCSGTIGAPKGLFSLAYRSSWCRRFESPLSWEKAAKSAAAKDRSKIA